MDFDAANTRRTYSDRAVDASWIEWCRDHLAPAGKDVIDIGCGGGIYTFGFADAGARTVLGVDQSAQYVDEAMRIARSRNARGVSFRVASAIDTRLSAGCTDIVFERALIHHLSASEQAGNAMEAKRLLRAGGCLVVQDRTFEDVLVDDPACWVRATLFEVFPALLDFERARRPARAVYGDILRDAGFVGVHTLEYREVRKRFESFAALEDEIRSRKGKSILYELSDGELRRYCAELERKNRSFPLIESDIWTVWLAR